MRKNHICEAIINGKRVEYDGCSSSPRAKADAYYLPLGMEYIGKGIIGCYVNGVRQSWFGEVHHFYRRKPVLTEVQKLTNEVGRLANENKNLRMKLEILYLIEELKTLL